MYSQYLAFWLWFLGCITVSTLPVFLVVKQDVVESPHRTAVFLGPSRSELVYRENWDTETHIVTYLSPWHSVGRPKIAPPISNQSQILRSYVAV